MQRAAQFRALAVIDSFAFGLEPRLVHAARIGVDLDAKRGQRPRVNNVRTSSQYTDGLVDRQHQMIVDTQQPRLALGLRVGVGQHLRVKCEVAVIGIFV